MEEEKEIEKPTEFVTSPYYIKLCSNDKQIFMVNKDVCMISQHLKTELGAGLKETVDYAGDIMAVEKAEPTAKKDGEKDEDDDAIKLDVDAEILEICIKFMHFKYINRQISVERPNFEIDPNLALRVLQASCYLKC